MFLAFNFTLIRLYFAESYYYGVAENAALDIQPCLQSSGRYFTFCRRSNQFVPLSGAPGVSGDKSGLFLSPVSDALVAAVDNYGGRVSL